MKRTISTKKQEYEVVGKFGMRRKETGEYIIPREYDRIEKISDIFFAAIKKEEEMLKDLDKTSGCGDITQRELELWWRIRDEYKSTDAIELQMNNFFSRYAASRIDFYSDEAKVDSDKDIIAYYWSEKNQLLILLHTNHKWSIATIDYKNQKLCMLQCNIDRIKETCEGKIFFERNDMFEIAFNGGVDHIGPYNFKEIIPYPKGFVAVTKNNKQGFLTYSQELVVDYLWDKVIPYNECIEVVSNVIPDGGKAKGIYSYEGKIVVPCDYLTIEIHNDYSSTLFVAHSRGIEGNIYYELYSNKGKISSKYFSHIEIQRFPNRIIYTCGGRYGLASYDEDSNKLKVIIPEEYDFIQFSLLDRNFVSVRKGNKYALFSHNGTQLSKFRRHFFIPEDEQKYHI